MSDKLVRLGNVSDIAKDLRKYNPRQSMIDGGLSNNNKKLAKYAREKVDNAEISLGTMVSMIGSEALASIVDEAGQVTEHHTLCAINPYTIWLILVGDHEQLPPCVVEEPGTEQGTGISALERMVKLCFPMTVLNIQYRMYPSIARFSSMLFNANGIENGVEEGQPPAGFFWARNNACYFMNVTDEEKKLQNSTNLYNDGEIACVTELVDNFLAAGIDPENVGVIAMYKTQAELLQSRVDPLGIACGKIASFHGQEKDMMLVSCVRSNRHERQGF